MFQNVITIALIVSILIAIVCASRRWGRRYERTRMTVFYVANFVFTGLFLYLWYTILVGIKLPQ